MICKACTVKNCQQFICTSTFDRHLLSLHTFNNNRTATMQFHNFDNVSVTDIQDPSIHNLFNCTYIKDSLHQSDFEHASCTSKRKVNN